MKTAAEFLQDFYSWYVSRKASEPSFPNVLHPALVLEPYVAASMLGQFFEIVVRTDADPVLAAQDIADWDTITATVLDGDASETICRVDFGNPVTHSLRATVTADPGGWKLYKVNLI